MLLMCCRLQELEVIRCKNMTDRGLLNGIGSLHELTSLRLNWGCNLTAEALSTFLHQPSTASLVSLDLSACCNLDDEGLKGVAERCNKLTYMSKYGGVTDDPGSKPDQKYARRRDRQNYMGRIK